jgi:hypothetical protein
MEQRGTARYHQPCAALPPGRTARDCRICATSPGFLTPAKPPGNAPTHHSATGAGALGRCEPLRFHEVADRLPVRGHRARSCAKGVATGGSGRQPGDYERAGQSVFRLIGPASDIVPETPTRMRVRLLPGARITRKSAPPGYEAEGSRDPRAIGSWSPPSLGPYQYSEFFGQRFLSVLGRGVGGPWPR